MEEVLEGILKEGCMAHSFVVVLCWEKRVVGNGKVKKHAESKKRRLQTSENCWSVSAKLEAKKEWEVDN